MLEPNELLHLLLLNPCLLKSVLLNPPQGMTNNYWFLTILFNDFSIKVYKLGQG
jgi:hypothetical protein